MNKLEETNFFFHYIGKINKKYSEYLNEELKQYNVNVGDISYLYCLYYQDNVTQENIAKRLNVNEATVTRAINRLENKNFVKRTLNTEDKRKKMIKLTKDGLKISNLISIRQKELEEKIIKNYSKEDQELFKNFLIDFLNYIQ